jgi:hypothetical protein
MTFFGRNDTEVALGETSETGVAITLAKAFPGDTTAVNAFNLLQVFNSDWFTEPVVQD